jgi:hypothetical protein
VLSIPDATEHVTKFADWVELSALLEPDGRIGFSTLVSAVDLEIEEQEADIADEDARQESLVNSVQAVIAERLKVVGPDYPFRIDDDGGSIELVAPITPVGAIYLFCLFLSHAYDRTVIPKVHAPRIDNTVRDLFQVCATVAAAGYVDGVATSFGSPRLDSERFLDALKRIYGMFGDGTPHATAPAGAPDQVKDDGIDVIAWRPSPDGLPGTHYLLGQVASGNDWQGKSVISYIAMFHKFWFSTQPASPNTPAMFIPFCVEPKGSDDPNEAQEIAVNNMQRLTNQFGVLIYRYRLPRFAAKGVQVSAELGHLVERIDELPKIERWVERYSDKLRLAANP